MCRASIADSPSPAHRTSREAARAPAGCRQRSTWWRLSWPVGVALLALGCSPTLDWREVPLGGDTRLTFPCKPDRLERPVPLLDRAAPARLWVCDAGGVTWSAMAVDLIDPARSADALLELRRKIVANLNATEAAAESVQVPGMTPGLPAWRLRAHGTRPDGRAVTAQVLLTAHGTQAFQLVQLSGAEAPAASRDGAAEFFDALRWSR